jgi:hypothetical protein
MGYFASSENYDLDPIATTPYRRTIFSPEGYFVAYANFPANKYWEYERTIFVVTEESGSDIQDIEDAFNDDDNVDPDLFECWHVANEIYISPNFFVYEIRSDDMF